MSGNQRGGGRRQPTQEQAQALMVVQPPRLPMPQDAAAAGVSPGRWKALVDAVFPSANSVDGVMLAIRYCQERNLDIMKRVVHVVPMWNAKLGREVETVWPGIGEMRTTASRTKIYAGNDECVFGPLVKKEFVASVQRQGRNGGEPYATSARAPEMEFPMWAQITVYKIVAGVRCAFPGPKVMFEEIFSGEKGLRVPNARWRQAPVQMLEKCFSPDTEILTSNGFERLDQVRGTILQVGTSGLEPVPDAKPFRQEYWGEMIACEGQSLNFMVTPNHDMLTDRGKLEAQTLLALSSSRPNYRIPLSMTGSRSDYTGVTDAQIRLAGAFLADGTMKIGAGKFCISVSRPRKVASLESMGLHLSRSIRKSAGHVSHGIGGRALTTRKDKHSFIFDRRDISRLIDGKALPADFLMRLSARQARLLVDTMIQFDGSSSKTSRRYYTSSADIAKGFELAAVIAGYAVSPRKVRFSDLSDLPNFVISISKKVSVPVLAASDKSEVVHVSPVNISGEVWCVTVPSGIIVVRRNGLSMLCGNCAEAAALRRAFPEELGDEWSSDEMEGKVMKADVPEGSYAVVSETPTAEEVQREEDQVGDDLQEGEESDLNGWDRADLAGYVQYIEQGCSSITSRKGLDKALATERATIERLPKAERATVDRYIAEAERRLTPSEETKADPPKPTSDQFLANFRKRLADVDTMIDLSSFEASEKKGLVDQPDDVVEACRLAIAEKREALKSSK